MTNCIQGRAWFAGLTFVLTFHLLKSYAQDRNKTNAIFSVSICNSYLSSFRYGSPICLVSTLPVLRYVIRLSFSSAPITIRMISFFIYYDKYSPWLSTIQLVKTRNISVNMLFIVDHCIRLRRTKELVNSRSHISQTQTISPVYLF